MIYQKISLISKIAFFIALSVYFSSCTYDNEEDLLEGFTCDTTDIVYNDLTYIFTDICAQCHNEVSTFREGIEMDRYESVKSSMETGKVLPAIKHEGDFNMPFDRPKLPDCDIQKIEAWYNAGMPEN